jgi:hypothetical protein
VAVYVVWSSQRGAREENVDGGTTLIPDHRVRHFWDPALHVGSAFAPVIGTGAPAWDVWMLFGPDATWPASGVPTPAWWEDQLGGLPPDRHLTPKRFAAKAAALERELK